MPLITIQYYNTYTSHFGWFLQMVCLAPARTHIHPIHRWIKTDENEQKEQILFRTIQTFWQTNRRIIQRKRTTLYYNSIVFIANSVCVCVLYIRATQVPTRLNVTSTENEHVPVYKQHSAHFSWLLLHSLWQDYFSRPFLYRFFSVTTNFIPFHE